MTVLLPEVVTFAPDDEWYLVASAEWTRFYRERFGQDDPPRKPRLSTSDVVHIVDQVEKRFQEYGIEGHYLPYFIYRIFDARGALIYVGQTCDLDERLVAHARSKAWWPAARRVEGSLVQNDEIAKQVEKELIRRDMPLYNVQESVRIGTLSAIPCAGSVCVSDWRRRVAAARIPLGAKGVAMVLGEFAVRDHGDDTTATHADLRELTEWCDAERRTVLTHLGMLERAGWLRSLLAPASRYSKDAAAAYEFTQPQL